MMKRWEAIILLFAIIIFSIGCSGGDATPVDPQESHSRAVEATSHNLWGLYTFICDPDAGTVAVQPIREADMHLNALKFLEPQPYTFLTIEGQPQIAGGILDIDIGLKNPYGGLDEFSGFDVCGIVFSKGSEIIFDDPALVMAGEGDLRLLNADGYTRWWNPVEFPHGDSMMGYIDGLIGTPADEAGFTSTVNGYKYFADGLNPNEPVSNLSPSLRGLFRAGHKNIRHYKIDMSGGLIFNYAVDACWKMPTGGPPYDIPADFPPGANRQEAWNVVVTELENTLYCVENTYINGGILKLKIDVYDHFNSDANTVRAYSPAGLPLMVVSAPSGGGEGFSSYELTFDGESLGQTGAAVLYIAVESEANGYGGALPGEPVSTIFKHDFTISPESPAGWAISWDWESSNEYSRDVAADKWGNIFILGNVMGQSPEFTFDLNPGPGADIRNASENTEYSFLIKLNPQGVYQWGKVWADAQLWKLDSDSEGSMCIAGWFYNVVDLDPGPGIDEAGNFGEPRFCLIKLDLLGNYIWGRHRPTSEVNSVFMSIDVNKDDDILVVGRFQGTEDFDPGPADDFRTSSGESDAYLCKYLKNGDYQWVRTWGSGVGFWQSDGSKDVSTDAMGSIFVVGEFQSVCDFDPGPDEFILHSNGTDDAFLSKFDSDGNFEWALAWGGEFGDRANSVTVDNLGNSYVTGYCNGLVDLDPGPGVFEVDLVETDSFISKFGPQGEFQWAGTWDETPGMEVVSDGLNNLFVAGNKAYLGRVAPVGGIVWAYRWGENLSGEDSVWAWALASDSMGNSFVTGPFIGQNIDFNPGPGVDLHSSNDYMGFYLSKFPPSGEW